MNAFLPTAFGSVWLAYGLTHKDFVSIVMGLIMFLAIVIQHHIWRNK